MEKKNKSGCYKNLLYFTSGIALTIAGFVIIPPLIEKYANKKYKNSLKKEEINFDEMGPEIVPFEEGSDK